MSWLSPPLPGLVLRPPIHGDGLAMARLYHEAFAEHGGAMLTSESVTGMVVAERDGEVVGIARSELATGDLVRTLHLLRARSLPTVVEGDQVLTALAVDPAHRRLGIGRRLAEGRIEAAEVSGAQHVFVHCVEGAGTEQLYDSLGFVTLGRVPGWYRSGRGMTLMAASLPRPA